MITELTPEQEALIRVYHKKWREITLETEPMDHHQASEAVNALYRLLGRKEPQIFFCDSPWARIQIILNLKQRPEKLGYAIGCELKRIASSFVLSKPKNIERQLLKAIESQLYNRRRLRIIDKIENLILIQIMNYLTVFCQELDNWFSLQGWAENQGSLVDFGISVLNCPHDREAWEMFQLLCKHCSVVYPFENIAIICDRPKKISIDSEGRLHAEAEAAVQFRDGYSFFAYHGLSLPEKYGKRSPSEWNPDWYLKELDFDLKMRLIEILPKELLRTDWILEERNTELRRALIQEIGYGKLCQELRTEKIDNWQEYELLRIAVKREKEPFHLLKMICPSTGHVHALRVSPEVTSAREAIRWINWGIDPEEFSLQT